MLLIKAPLLPPLTLIQWTEALGISHLQKFWKIPSGNFCLGRAHSTSHKFHSREPRDGKYETGDKDEKSVDGIQISIGKFTPGKWAYLLRNSVYSGNFPVEQTKKSCSIYIPIGISNNISW